MNLVKVLLRTSRGSMILTVLVGICGGVGGVGLLGVINRAFEANHPSNVLLGTSFAVLCVVVLLTRIISQAQLIRLSQKATCRLCLHLSRHILGLPLQRLEEIGGHRLLAVLTDDILTVAHALQGIPVLCINLAIMAGCLVYLAWLSPTLLLGLLVFLALGVLSYEWPVLRATHHLRSAREDQDALLKHFGALTGGVKELKIHRQRREAFLTDFLEPTAQSFREHGTAGLTLYAVAGSWGQLLFFVAIGSLLFLVPAWQTVPRPLLTGFVLTILYTMSPLESILAWLPTLARARVALRQIDALGLLLADQEGQTSPSTAPAHKGFQKSLALVGVAYTYRPDGDGDGFSLGPLDLTLRPGELTFLVGGNGSGKTTLAKLLTGLYPPEAGAVYLDGQPVPATTAEEYRQLFSVVFADAHLFEGLLGLNISEADARVARYLGQLELDQKVGVNHGRFSTLRLSQGQRKRLALLTALLEDRPIYVLDEWAADQEPRFKKTFYTQILPGLKARGKAVVVISHDDRYFNVADHILKLEYGKLSPEERRHDALGHR